MAGSSSFTSYVGCENDQPLVVIDDDVPQQVVTTQVSIEGMTNTDSNLLISLADDTNSALITDPRESENRNKTTLCGYLNKLKQGARGKNFKRRWFVYNENTCKLMYYRTPQDIVPHGEIEIANAALSFEVPPADSVSARANMFEISSDGKVYYLEASDQQTMMYWLQQLQIKRRNFSHQTTHASADTFTGQLQTVQEPSGGLVGKTSVPYIGDNSEVSLPMTPVECPEHSVGERAASVQSKNPLADISISNWKTEVRNVFASMRLKRNSDGETPVAPNPSPRSPSPQPTNTGDEPGSRLSRFQNLKRRMRSKSQEMDSQAPNWTGSSESLCSQCRHLENSICYYKEEAQQAEEEVLATRELLRILQKDIDLLQRKMKTQSSMYESGPLADHIAELQQKDKTIVDLEHLVATIKEEKEIENVSMRMLEAKVESIEQDLEMYRDSLRSKDSIVMSMTNQLFELEKKLAIVDRTTIGTNTTLQRKPVDALEIERLRDGLSAYQLQNRFLNKEILELSKLRAQDERRQREIFMRCAEWEAKYYQINSKFLLCLDQLRLPRMGGEGPTSDVVQQLLDDAMGLQEGLQESGDHTEDLLTSQSLSYSISKQRLTKKYDKYGFLVWPCTGDDLVERANTMQRRTDQLLVKDVNKEISQNVQWENLLASVRNRELSRSQELKNLVRKGIPYQHKENIWNACINFRVGKLREKLGPNYYQNLLDQMKKQSHRHNPAAKQIALDLLRTLPNNCHYETMSSDGIPKLKRVLLAYTQHNPDLGYCQGQNRLAAIALLFLDEEDAFWCLVAITEYLMPPDYYSTTLSAAQVDQRVFKDLMMDKLPLLTAHIEILDIDLSLFTFNWFLTIFVDNIPTETYLRVWDSFLYEGNKVLFRFALAFFKDREKEILAINDNLGLHNYLRTLGENSTDVDKIAELAFHGVNPLPMRSIETRRQTHMVQVKNELAELDALRSKFRSTRRQKPRSVADFVSDDEG